MSITTQHYGLKAFTRGDYYSASSDKKRFTIIDSQLAFLSDRIGSGKIDGWNISIKDIDALLITVSPGMGIIGRNVLQSFGYFDFTVENNKIKYIYMKRKSIETGGFSGFSNMAEIEGSGSTVPSSPSGLISPPVDSQGNILESLITYNQVAFSWEDNSEVDFSHYIIKRKESDEYEEYETLIETTDTLYIDENLLQDTLYSYQVISVNFSGKESDPSEIDIRTEIDTRVPLPPSFLQIIIGNGSLQCLWDDSSSDYVNSYMVEVQLLDNNYNKDGDPILISVDSESEFGATNITIDDLDNNKKYRIFVRSISYSGISSEPIYKTSTPLFSEGPAEVEDISVSFSESEFENIGIETDISWSYFFDPYFSFPDKFEITFIENGNRISEPIVVREDSVLISNTEGEEGYFYYSNHIKFIPFLGTDGNLSYESIKEYTHYVIIIKTMVEDETSGGSIYRINKTPLYELLPVITEEEISRIIPSNDILVKWVNPSLYFFDYCKVTVNIINLNEEDEEYLYLEDYNTGKSSRFIIPSTYFDTNSRYVIKVTPVDIFGRDGDSLSFGEQFIETDVISRPDSPNVSVFNGDGNVRLEWGDDLTGEISSYKIYRADNQNFYLASSFSLIQDNITSSYNYYIDYDVENGESYTYFVTSVDIYGNESLNTVDDNFVPIQLLYGNPVQSSILVSPSSLVVSSNLRDVILTWEATSGSYDGYEIHRSIGNSFSFELIGYAFASEISYTDTDALLKDGETYYYLVRKFRNETNIFVTESTDSPTDSIFLGKVTTYISGSEQIIDINNDLSINLKNLEDFITSAVDDKILDHKHSIDIFGDKRIELRSNAIIDSWTTVDFQVYETTEDIEGADGYIIKVGGTINEDYFIDENGNTNFSAIKQAQMGFPPVLYSLNESTGVLTFNSPLYDFCVEPEEIDPLNPEKKICSVLPYLTEPTISVEMVNISEVTNYLPQERIEEVNATQFDSGVIAKEQISSIQHEGRINEELIPLRLPTQTNDNFIYSLDRVYTDDDKNKMGTSVTFYDIISLEYEDRLLAATSSGIWFSNNFGNLWSKKVIFPEACHRIFISNENTIYAITNYGVYLNDSSNYDSWIIMSGLEAVSVIRDIVEDSNENLYITTNLGVFRLNKDKPYIEDTWEQLSIFGVRSTEAYGIIYVDEENTIFSSNELGILESTNEGKTWSYIKEIPNLTKVIRFFRENDYIFALTNDSIFRKKVNDGSFIKVCDIEANICRNIVIFNDRIYITTDMGAMGSVSDNIYVDDDIQFVSIYSSIQSQNNKVITSLNVIENNLFIGTDMVLYLLNNENKIWIQYEQIDKVIPSVYKNDKEQVLGFYYCNDGAYHNVSFDEQLEYEDVIEVVTKYDIYVAKNGGWVGQKYDASFNIWQNNLSLSTSQTDISIDTNNFLLFEFPDIDDTNSNFDTAQVYEILLQDNIDKLTGLNPPEGEELTIFISDTYILYEKFISQLYSGHGLSFPDIIVNTVTKQAKLSPLGEVFFEETYAGAKVNVVLGQVVFDTQFNKFDKLTIDIKDCTVKNAGVNSHREVEDSLELVNSGFTSFLSQVQQVNICKLGLFVEKEWGEQEDYSTPVQSNYFIPQNSSFYDTLNSTINYEEQKYEKDISFSISYPTSVYYSSNIRSIIVGGDGGIILIDIDTLEVTENSSLNITEEIVRQIKRNNDIIYLLTNKNIYKSEDFGNEWEVMDRSGLPINLYSMGFVYNNIIIGTQDGIYYKSSDYIDWERSLESVSPVEIIINPDLLFVVVDNIFYTTGDGYNFSKLEIDISDDIISIVKVGPIIYVATKYQLYSDNKSFYGKDPELTVVVLDENIIETIYINDLYVDGDNLVIAMSNGVFYTLGVLGSIIYEHNVLDTIQKILVIEDNFWAFGYGSMKSPTIDFPIRLTTGVPF